MKTLFSACLNCAVTTLAFFALQGTALGLTITTTNNATVLANTIGGPGITISNPVYSGAAGASGLFGDGLAAGISLPSGIILTTGSATNALPPNNNDGKT